MTGMMRWVGFFAAGALLVGCGGDGDAQKPDDQGTDSSAPASAPTPSESEECRAAVSRADTIASELETAVIEDVSQFNQFFDRLTVLQEDVAQCTARVSGDFAEGMSTLSGVPGTYTACDFVEMCDKSKIERDLVDGTGLIHEAAATANNTG